MVENKGTRGEKNQTKESAWKRCFYVHLHGKKKSKYTAWNIGISENSSHEPNCSIAVIIQELPNGNDKIRVGVGERATKEKVGIMYYFFSSFR